MLFVNQIISLCFNDSLLSNFNEFKKRILLSVPCTFQFAHTDNNKGFNNNKDKFNTITTTFIHSVLDNVIFNRILNNSYARNVIKETIKQFHHNKLVYAYSSAISHYLFNYNKTLKSINKEELFRLVNSNCICNKVL